MENKNLTAVEWLDRWFRDNPEATHEEGNKALEQAKAIEKEHIAKAWDAGNHQVFNYNILNEYYDNGEEYYNENYKNK